MSEAKTYTVGEVNILLKELIEGSGLVANIQVQGEVSNFKKYPSGHCYFTLKDATGVLKCVMFRYRAVQLQTLPANGDTVLAVGHISVYERDGIYQLYVDVLIQQGLGNLMQAYEKLKKKLEQEGLFAAERKQALPVHPERVGIITSPVGAAVRDIITVSRRRNPGIKLLLFPVKVQGEGAGAEIVRAISFMNKHQLADVLIVGRGGGSIEDLWAFNEEPVVRAIAASKLPVISSVGHETDFTLADFAADKRAATPSQAAEFAVPDTLALVRQVEELEQRGRRALQQQLGRLEATYTRLAAARVLQNPEAMFELPEERLDKALMRLRYQLQNSLQEPQERLQQAELKLRYQMQHSLQAPQERLQQAGLKLRHELQGLLEQRSHALGLLAARLDGVSPLAVLSRGYSVTLTQGGQKKLTSINDVRWGEELLTQVPDGTVISVVQQTERRENYGK